MRIIFVKDRRVEWKRFRVRVVIKLGFFLFVILFLFDWFVDLWLCLFWIEGSKFGYLSVERGLRKGFFFDYGGIELDSGGIVLWVEAMLILLFYCFYYRCLN